MSQQAVYQVTPDAFERLAEKAEDGSPAETVFQLLLSEEDSK